LSPPRLRPLVLTLVAVLLCGEVRSRAQDVTEVTLKGAFILNFARFTQWPADALPPSSVVSACVVGDPAIGGALRRVVSASGHRLHGRTVQVSSLADDDASIARCHLLYVSGLDRARTAQLIARLRDTSALTVGDDETFITAGGIIRIFVENGKMRFAINPRAATRARLQLSSRLLALADVVDEDPRQPAAAGPIVPARRHD
jgi:hypothetical protein